jgi:GNAT superfamily N-acetyltransferase
VVEVRRIRPGEHDAAGDVCVAAYDPLLTGAEDDYRDRLRDVATRDEQAEVWVAVRDEGGADRVVGVVTYCPPGSPWREIGRDEEGEFRMLAVDPAAQGTGAGTALARLCEQRAREHGATGMALSSLATMTAAHRIYARLGYEREPGRDWSPVPGVDLLAFSKPL